MGYYESIKAKKRISREFLKASGGLIEEAFGFKAIHCIPNSIFNWGEN